MDCSWPGSFTSGISQARILQQAVISFSREASQPRYRTHISCISRQILFPWAIWEAHQDFLSSINSQRQTPCSATMKVKVKESESRSVMSYSLRPHGLSSPWNSLDQNTGVGSRSLLQGTFPIQGSNPGLPYCRRILYQLSHNSIHLKISSQIKSYIHDPWIFIFHFYKTEDLSATSRHFFHKYPYANAVGPAQKTVAITMGNT